MISKTIEMMSVKGLLEEPLLSGYYSNLTGASYEDLVYEDNGGNSAWLGSFAVALAAVAAVVGFGLDFGSAVVAVAASAWL